MPGRIERRLAELGLVIPEAEAPVANYVPWVREGGLLFLAGQIGKENGRVRHQGQVGGNLTPEDGYAAARLCAINLIAQARAALTGDLDRVRRVLKLTGFVHAASGFTDHPKVLDGASDLMVAVFGDAGRHARAAVGVVSLPAGAAVEVEAILAVE